MQVPVLQINDHDSSFLFLEGMKERFSQLGIVSDFEFLVGEEADYEVIRFLKIFNILFIYKLNGTVWYRYTRY